MFCTKIITNFIAFVFFDFVWSKLIVNFASFKIFLESEKAFGQQKKCYFSKLQDF